MRLIDGVSHFLDVSFFLVLGHKWLLPTQSGGHLVTIFESGIASWVYTRANTALLAEVSALQTFFTQSSGVVIAALIVLAISPFKNLPVVQQIMGSLRIILLIACVGWVSLDWTFNHRASIRSSLTLRNILTLALAVVTTILIAKPVTERFLIQISQAQGWGLSSGVLVDTLTIIVLIVVLLFGALFAYMWFWVFFGGLSFCIVGMIYATSLLSGLLIRTVNRDVAWELVFLASVLFKAIKPLL
jgi:hypothetical protein